MKVFEKPGPINTDAVIKIAKEASGPYKYIVVASITGDSAIKVTERIHNKTVICVTCPQGMSLEVDKMNEGPFANIPELKEIRDQWIRKGLKKVPTNITDENRKILNEWNVRTIQGTIPLFGPSFSIRIHLGQITSLDIIAKTLELISPGTLVGLECVLMAVDAGVIPENEHVLALAGTERGLDTAWIIKSSASANMFHPSKGCRFVELLAKPGLSLQPDVNIAYVR